MVGMYWEDWEIGKEFVSPSRTITEADIILFAGYAPVKTAYATRTPPSAGAMVNARDRARTARTAATISAVVVEISPAAIGRRRLTGCARSASTSRTSFTRYVALEIKQNATKDPTLTRKTSGLRSLPAASGAANTRTFLAH